jgi:hypothetical protein
MCQGMKDALVTSAKSFRSTKVQADLSLSGSLKSTAAYSQEAKARLAAKSEEEEEEEE